MEDFEYLSYDLCLEVTEKITEQLNWIMVHGEDGVRHRAI